MLADLVFTLLYHALRRNKAYKTDVGLLLVRTLNINDSKLYDLGGSLRESRLTR